MHTIDDDANGIILNFNSDWSGEVRVAWYDVKERRDKINTGPVPSLRECWCDGEDLIAGHFRFVNRPAGNASTPSVPPVDVMTRAVALAVETYLIRKMATALDDICIDRRKVV
jgi:hypothetical protein